MTDGIKKKECPRCGTEFFCHADSDAPCWCMSYDINPENLKVLGIKYKGCICPECLKLYGQKRK
ncbi:cysteine-rich CWC family protein [Carboxylicivirga marina]|uniref:Cysteine-rich CWC family protein n=1 Tax=Carboxylicivirga marina TaxID=2800988 RepID=A0ABS1HMG8_9BACT|nr:cysteine-rich CWC family protein [Carboxylicivirga marina]